MRSTLVVMAALCSPATASACGGFFCDNAAPVDQSGERLLFAIDDDAGEVEMHAQISYEGPSEDFGWILPVPSEPKIFVSNDDVFNILGTATDPTFQVTFEAVGNCPSPPRIQIGGQETALGSPQDGGEFGGVTVVSQAAVGPYDTEVLSATSTEDLVSWLELNDYDLPPNAIDKIRPYVDSGSYFVGLRLSKGRDDGDMVPIGLRFDGSDPIIPLQLTAVAATDDMRLQPMVLANARAVPESYLHVEINELAVDWLSAGDNYLDVITMAADEAGGQAFATDFAGSTDAFSGLLWSEGLYDTTPIASVTDATDLTSAMFSSGMPISTGTIPILSRFVSKPARSSDIADSQFYGCLDCFLDRGEISVDGAALAATLQTEWIDILRDAQQLVDRFGTLTRMTSSISADEMTVDPRFVVNPDMPDVTNVHTAVVQVLCRGRFQYSKAPRTLVLEDGRELSLPSFEDMTGTWEEELGEMTTIGAAFIEATGRSGAPEMVTDNRATIHDALTAHNETARGCGCSGAPTQAGWAWLGLIGWLVRRRWT